MTAETLKRFYKPGAIVWNSYYRHYELVLDFEFHIESGYSYNDWYAKVVPCTENGIPNGNQYKHCRQPTQDCFDGTQTRIRGLKPRFGMISPETQQIRLERHRSEFESHSGLSYYQEQEAGKPE